MLRQLLNDADGYVRSYVCMGIDWAVKEQRASEIFLQAMYPLVLDQCDQKWAVASNDAARTLIAIARQRAAIDLCAERFLSKRNSEVHRILQACNSEGIILPEEKVRSLLDHSLPMTSEEKCYPLQYIVAGALRSLARSMGAQAEPLLRSAMDNRHKEIQEAAADGLAILAGVGDPVRFVLDLLRHKAFEDLTPAQKVVYCAFMFDAEVCNGGLLQFFGNSSGEHVSETLRALQVLGHSEGEHALSTAVKLAGPLSKETDRELRMTAFEDRFDELKAAYHPLESAYYDKTARLHQQMLEYAAQFAEDFKSVK
jgi:hypothetical protein